ncbi:MAG: DUF4292 domain-containing protein [Candidatus Binatia bacterium]
MSSTTIPSRSERELPTVEELLAPLRNRQQQIPALRGLARVAYTDKEEKGTARQAVAVRSPDHFRIELFSPIGIAALVATDGEHLAAYFPQEKTIYRGEASAVNAARFLQIMLSAKNITQLLLGLPLSFPYANQGEVMWNADRDEYRLSSSLYGGQKQILSFDSRHRRLQRWEVQDKDGRTLARMNLSDYRVIQKQEFPFEIILSDLQGGQEARVYYEQVEIFPSLPDTLFTLTPIVGVQEIDLDATSTP